MMINEDYHENLTEESLLKLLDQAKSDLDSGKSVGKSTRKDGVWP
jgi:hypothetical protein